MRLWFVAWGTGPDPRRDNYETAGAPVQARAVPDGFDFSAASTRSGVKGTWRSRTPTASKIALPIAAGITIMAGSAPPVGGSLEDQGVPGP